MTPRRRMQPHVARACCAVVGSNKKKAGWLKLEKVRAPWWHFPFFSARHYQVKAAAPAGRRAPPHPYQPYFSAFLREYSSRCPWSSIFRRKNHYSSAFCFSTFFVSLPILGKLDPFGISRNAAGSYGRVQRGWRVGPDSGRTVNRSVDSLIDIIVGITRILSDGDSLGVFAFRARGSVPSVLLRGQTRIKGHPLFPLPSPRCAGRVGAMDFQATRTTRSPSTKAFPLIVSSV